MSQNSTRDRVVCFLRILLGFVFLYASIGKILDPKSFTDNLIAYHLIDSPTLIKYLAVSLPWLEWLCGILLVLGVFVRSVSILTSVLLVVFVAIITSALARGLSIQCGCFGSPSETVGAFSIIRDTLLLAVSIAVALLPVDGFSLQGYLEHRKTGRVMTISRPDA